MTQLMKKISSVLPLLLLAACDNAVDSTMAENTIKGVMPIGQSQLNELAKNLQVNYKFFSNIETDCPDDKGKKIAHCYSAEISLTNTSASLVTDWQVNFSQVYPTYAAKGEQLTLVHINGDIHQIAPNENFTGFNAGESKIVKLWVASTLIGESELMPNYWLAAKNLSPAVIESTKTTIDPETKLEIQPYVVSFDNVDKQIKSAPDDINQYASAERIYQNNIDVKKESKHLPFAVIPTPKSLRIIDESKRIDLASGINIELDSVNNDFTKKDIAAALERLNMLGVSQNKKGFAVKVKLNSKSDEKIGSYQLSINEKEITILSTDKTGAFYGLQTLASLLTLGDLSVPLIEIDDEPRYAYRGQHLDVARNFHDKEMVFALIKQMAAYKLNKLHLHLAEDEGWRLALPSFPELTDVGSKRCMDLSDQNCLQPQLGGASATDRDGYYSVSDYQEILTMASRHHIQVIPSLDMPGHSRAAIKAMEARYRHYMKKENEPEAIRYLLSDFDDKTQYSSIQNYNDNTINICMESAYTFVDRVLEDLQAMHNQVNHPLTMYHIGADETAGAWIDSPVCQALIKDKSNEVNDEKHLGAHFIERVSNMIASKGIAVGGWNDGLGETHVENMPKDVYSYIWGPLPKGAHKQVSEQAGRGWNVILSTPDVFYFDFPYEIDPKERGYHWASRRTNSRSIFNFMPDNLPVHAEFRVNTAGQPFSIDDRLKKDEQGNVTHQPLPKNYHVSGIQGQLWSETIRSEQQAEYMIYPRLLTLAERAWHKPSWEVPYNYQGAVFDRSSGVFTANQKANREQAWQQFSNTLGQKELAKLDKAGVFYRIPTVGAKIIAGKLNINSSLVGLPLEYSQADGDWQSYQQPVEVTLPVTVRARTIDRQRAGRSLILSKSQK
ncbi:MAG: hexosaminidase [Alteromonadaceae bacterium]|jgi:hexosaminidase